MLVTPRSQVQRSNDGRTLHTPDIRLNMSCVVNAGPAVRAHELRRRETSSMPNLADDRCTVFRHNLNAVHRRRRGAQTPESGPYRRDRSVIRLPLRALSPECSAARRRRGLASRCNVRSPGCLSMAAQSSACVAFRMLGDMVVPLPGIARRGQPDSIISSRRKTLHRGRCAGGRACTPRALGEAEDVALENACRPAFA